MAEAEDGDEDKASAAPKTRDRPVGEVTARLENGGAGRTEAAEAAAQMSLLNEGAATTSAQEVLDAGTIRV